MKILKKRRLSLIIIILSLIFCINLGLNNGMVKAETILKTGISKVENVPSGLFGTWRVAAVLKNTDSPQFFREKSADLWNLSRNNNVMNLNNPFTGASADLAVEFVKGNVVKFTKIGTSGDNKLVDTVEITLDGDKFTGVNILTLKTYSNGKVIKVQNAEYVLVGEKISGMSVIGK
ncbi:hypothetical protein J6A31_07920 [bacterium]|nr:hypothetical protein [bacterium]